MSDPPLSSRFRSWSALVDAIGTSPNAAEREHFFQGVIDGTSRPLLIALDLLKKHALITGGTGSGKSSCALLSWCAQSIRRKDLSLAYMDLKYDDAVRSTLGLEARRAGLNFRWFTTVSSRSSYVLNPLLGPFWRSLSLSERTEILMAGFGLDHGDSESGTSYFEAQNEARLRGAIESAPDARSFRELYTAITAPGLREAIGMSRRDYENAGNVQAILGRLARCLPLNAIPGDGTPESVFRGAITLEQMNSRPGVYYFGLPATAGSRTNAVICRLIVRMLIADARMSGARGPQKFVVLDECQEVLQKSLATPIKQARDLGISFWMACQNLSDLVTPEVDFLNVILGNTAVRIQFSASDPLARDYITRTAGESVRITRGRADTVTEVSDRGTNTGVTHRQQEEFVPRYTQDDINRLNATPGLCLVECTPKSGFTRLNHPVFVRAPFTMSQAEYRRRQELPWPAPNRFTVLNNPAQTEDPDAMSAPLSPEAAATDGVPPPADNTEPPAASVNRSSPRRRRRQSARSSGQPLPLTPAEAEPGAEASGEPAATQDPAAQDWAAYLRRLAGADAASQQAQDNQTTDSGPIAETDHE